MADDTQRKKIDYWIVRVNEVVYLTDDFKKEITQALRDAYATGRVTVDVIERVNAERAKLNSKQKHE